MVMQSISKSYVVDFYLDGCYLKSQSLLQDHKLEVGEVVNVSLPKNNTEITGKVVDILDMSEDEYHIYLRSF
jgi:hypothetical protein